MPWDFLCDFLYLLFGTRGEPEEGLPVSVAGPREVVVLLSGSVDLGGSGLTLM